jgi:hypothetical protein
MKSATVYWRLLFTAVVAFGLFAVGQNWAEAKDKNRSDAKKSRVVEVDLNKLPPALAKQLMTELAKSKARNNKQSGHDDDDDGDDDRDAKKSGKGKAKKGHDDDDDDDGDDRDVK